MIDFMIFSRREALIFIWNLKKEIPYLLCSKSTSVLNYTYLPPAETNTIVCRLYTYKILSLIVFAWNLSFWNAALILTPSSFDTKEITYTTLFYSNTENFVVNSLSKHATFCHSDEFTSIMCWAVMCCLYSFCGEERGYIGVRFPLWTIIETIWSVSKAIVHEVSGRVNVVVVFFKIEGGGCHVTRYICSDNEIISLGSCCCYLVWFYKPLYWGILHWFLVVFSTVLLCLWRFYNRTITVIGHPWILYSLIEKLWLMYIPVDKFWLEKIVEI